MGNLKKVSVVIATIGEPSLGGVINSLNSGTLIPSEIIICIPSGLNICADIRSHENVKIKECVEAGQVLQRIEGFKLAKYDLVMQLDSDIHVHTCCLENLVSAMDRLPQKSCLSPFPEKINRGGMPNYFINNYLQKKIQYLWLERKKAGKIRRSCTISSPYTYESPSLYTSEWVNGIVIHRRENLILNNYYPFNGKAYYEDVIHSIILKKKGVSLWISQDAKIIHLNDSLTEYVTFGECLKYFRKILIVRRHILNINGGSKFLVFSVWLAEVIYSFAKVLFFQNYLRLIKKY